MPSLMKQNSWLERGRSKMRKTGGPPRYSDANLPEEANIGSDAIDAAWRMLLLAARWWHSTKWCTTASGADVDGCARRQGSRGCTGDRRSTPDPERQWSGTGSAEWMIPKALWLKRNEPKMLITQALFANIRIISQYASRANVVHH